MALSRLVRVQPDGVENVVKDFMGKYYIDSSNGDTCVELLYVQKVQSTAYFPTGINSINQDTRVVIDTYTPDINYSIFGSFNGNANILFNMTGQSGKDRMRWNNQTIDLPSAYKTTRHIYDMYKGIKVTNVSTGAVEYNTYGTLTGTFSIPIEMWLGCRNRQNAVDDATTTQYIYSCKIYQNQTTLVRDFVPAQSMNTNKYGLFDRVEMKFYAGSYATGGIIGKTNKVIKLVNNANNKVVNFNYTTYEPLSYLASETSKNALSTGVCPLKDEQGLWEFKYQFSSAVTFADIGCGGNSSSTNRFFVSDDNPTDNKFNLGIMDNHTNQAGVLDKPNIFGLNPHTSEYWLNGVKKGTSTNLFNVNPNPWYIFKRGSGNSCPGLIFYYLRIYNIAGTQILYEAIPARRLSDYAIGILNTITNTFIPYT